MHTCTGQGCRGCAQEAAKMISDWGSEGVRSAARIVGEDVAEGMLANHVQQNVRQSFPDLEVQGDETTEELQRKIKRHQREAKESKLKPEERKAVEEARKTLRKHGLLDE